MRVQRPDRRDDLPHEIQRGVQVEHLAGALDIGQDLDEPGAGHAIGHEHHGAALVVEPVDLPDAGVAGMLEIGQPRDALAQREVERRDVGDLVAETQNVDRRIGVIACGRTVSPAEAVLETSSHVAGFGWGG